MVHTYPHTKDQDIDYPVGDVNLAALDPVLCCVISNSDAQSAKTGSGYRRRNSPVAEYDVQTFVHPTIVKRDIGPTKSSFLSKACSHYFLDASKRNTLYGGHWTLGHSVNRSLGQ